MKYIAIDIETTGDNPEKHQILQFGAVIEDTENIVPLEELPKYEVNIKRDSIFGTAFALQMNQKILLDIANNVNCVEEDELPRLFKEFLKENGFETPKLNNSIELPIKVIPCGKNFGSFDLQFLERIHNFNWYVGCSHRYLDPSNFSINWDSDDSLPNSKICKDRANIMSDVHHTAVADCLDAIQIMRIQTNYYGQLKRSTNGN